MAAADDRNEPARSIIDDRRPRWTIPWVMQVVAIAAGLFTIARVPMAFGGFLMAIPIIQFVIVAIKGRRYARIAGLLCLAPALPLLAFYLDWSARQALSLAGELPFHDWFDECTAGMFLALFASMPVSLAAYLACIMLVMYAKENSALWHASIGTFVAMPLTWAVFLTLAAWDPLGIETNLIPMFLARIFYFA